MLPSAARTLGVVAAMTALVAAPVGACSLIPTIHPMFGPRVALMLATSTSDTMFAGKGPVVPTNQPGHNGPISNRAIYGQVMNVDSALGPGSRSARRVVLVPWDYGPDCHPTVWGNAAAWRRPGTAGLYRGMLRDSAQWAGGLPTYDVFAPEFEPYEGSSIGGRGSQRADGDTARMLSPLELFSVAHHFPVVNDRSAEMPAILSFLEWARANPAVSRREPIADALGHLTYRVRYAKLETLSVDVAGTYRFAVTVAGSDSAVFFGRTNQQPTFFADFPSAQPQPLPPRNDPTYIEPITGYSLLIMFSPELSTLEPRSRLQWSLEIPLEPATRADSLRIFEGRIQGDIAWRTIPAGIVNDAVKQMGVIPATFTVAPGGRTTIEHRSRLRDGREVVIRGEWLSREVFGR